MFEVEEWLHSRIGLNFRSGLGRMQQAVDLLGNPEKTYPIIHVTGTNGKGSTIAFMRELFVAHGKKVGTFTSPHIISIHDRICINGQAIADADFIRLAEQVKEMEKTLLETHDQLSFFELLTLIALLYFKEQGVDLVLLEVGIGGLLDTTNVVIGEIAVITSIGLDHQETLGDSLEEIAEQKAGIFKAGKKAVIAKLAPEAELVCHKRARELDVDLYQAGQDFTLNAGDFSSSLASFSQLEIGLEGAYQQENAALALETFLLFMASGGERVEEELVRQAFKETRWAGRLERIRPHIYLDGAHNLPALIRLVEFIQGKIQQGYQVRILFGALKRKDYQGMLGYLSEQLPQVELKVTGFDYQGSLDEKDVAGYDLIPSYGDFIREFEERANDQDLLFVTGSLYFISEVRASLVGSDGIS
ncbi:MULTISPECIES: bifunctional folylpolyglutamate synthase/dihydrofolate synthase [Streptococcus]|uniref:tetrahydrofolate synthase n=2 Tax=Streptococcus oralis TaxID=1303 RepID=A0A1X1JAQ7_STROR|nr:MULTISPECIES: folylpolyglutamate synthase/dihydrofolate synthase family protein [Streptococcus]EFA25352.1 bifunctional protein FolC [Streptococcus sp. M143]MCY7069845.1 bifunctional folylpolyglutamate synthase/dihydrofolate synthase [Streptococcus oralis]MCY7089602.1 bifunctional folylpolyglutamate synthase/dihydrofolate synthase [Streptococcus oralis]ORO83226.1 dihydrofolate synthase [Streptococcus oralis subsp. dentisani]ORO83622.1 dihydrofolate synthase [Streptococcus oralis subsp. denti